jgi:ketosteroid isomerase-like protein
VLANEDHAVALQNSIGEREGRSLNVHAVIVFHVRDGHVVEAWENNEDTQVWDEFWA